VQHNIKVLDRKYVWKQTLRFLRSAYAALITGAFVIACSSDSIAYRCVVQRSVPSTAPAEGREQIQLANVSSGLAPERTIIGAGSWPNEARTPMLAAMKRLLLIFGGHAGGRIASMTESVRAGIDELSDEIELRCLAALDAGVDDLLWAEGLLIGTPEHFGYMSGAVKDFLDRTFYPVEGKVDSLPYAIYISAGNDGTGAASSIERIALGYKWKRIAEPLIVRGEPTPQDFARCRELGQTMAAGLSAGIF